MNEASTHTDKSPTHCNSRNHSTELGFFDYYRSSRLDADIGNIKDTGCHVELYPRESDICVHILNTCIADIESEHLSTVLK